jgi:hypothetical protein
MEEIGGADYITDPEERDLDRTGRGLFARPVQLPFGNYRLVSD